MGMNEPEFWGDPLGPRHTYMRVVYNNVNGLRVGEFISTTEKYEVERKKDEALTPKQDATKLRGVLTSLERWDANIICLAET